jgi:hypothetical protein
LATTSATLSGPADVARVQADAVRAGVDRLERERVVEVDVGDDRDRRLGDDRPQRLDVLLARDGAAHDVGAGLRDGAICSSVAATFAVSVFVMVCTTTGAPPPTRTPPTLICRSEAIHSSVGVRRKGFAPPRTL